MTSAQQITEDEYARLSKAIQDLKSNLLAQLPDDDVRDQILEIYSFRDSIGLESDRGAALMAAAYLDNKLAELLRLRLVDDAKTVKEALDVKGPLGTFSSRINFCFLLGAIPANARNDLHLIRKIRNDFAHVAGPITFDDASVAEHCGQLTFHSVKAAASPGSKFRRSVMGLLSLIVFELKDLERLPEMATYQVPDGSEVYSLVADIFEKTTGKPYPLHHEHN
ncbi:DUF4145 domain-containing protein [Dyella choica]|uniref:DUF4145 domain-containing protein n=1 Tax=Dyella choica TaxID=1927959 RepID=A0A3S0PEZ8_9GAMM|nr:DUF4145 domain-containing protein [Dyella choica]RUL68504.1 DUF4145 domain-containing protein [Dyella choica]